jgi:hypothetical protein
MIQRGVLTEEREPENDESIPLELVLSQSDNPLPTTRPRIAYAQIAHVELAKPLPVAAAAAVIHFEHQRSTGRPDVRWVVASIWSQKRGTVHADSFPIHFRLASAAATGLSTRECALESRARRRLPFVSPV